MDQIGFDKPTSTDRPSLPEARDRLAQALAPNLSELGDISRHIEVALNKGYIAVKAKSLLSVKIVVNSKSIWMEYRAKYDELFSALTVTRSKEGNSRISFERFEDLLSMAELICVIATQDLMTLSGEGFACCSRFEECSDARKCTQSMLLLSFACQYRKNLEQGRIFYGRNRTV